VKVTQCNVLNTEDILTITTSERNRCCAAHGAIEENEQSPKL